MTISEHCASVKRVYVAAPLRQAAVAHRVADALTRDGSTVTSTWFRDVLARGATEDPRDYDQRRCALASCLGEVIAADVLVALMHEGTPRATIGEIAWALCLGKPVLWTVGWSGEGCNLFDAHSLVTMIRVRNEGGRGVNMWLEREMIDAVLDAARRIR